MIIYPRIMRLLFLGMFKKLYQYILGVNSLAEEIEMTSPVTTVRTPLSRNRERHEMCFWTGKPWENRELPEPLKPDVYIQEREAMQVFVRYDFKCNYEG